MSSSRIGNGNSRNSPSRRFISKSRISSAVLNSSDGNSDPKSPKFMGIRIEWPIYIFELCIPESPPICSILHKSWWALGMLEIRKIRKSQRCFELPAVGNLDADRQDTREFAYHGRFILVLCIPESPSIWSIPHKSRWGFKMVEIRKFPSPFCISIGGQFCPEAPKRLGIRINIFNS